MEQKSIHISESFLNRARKKLIQNKDAIYQVVQVHLTNCPIPRAYDLVDTASPIE